MRICSLLPGATEIVAALGLANDLVAISHECDYPPEIRPKPIAIRSRIAPDKTASPQIDRQIRDAVERKEGLYRIDEALLRRLAPDLVLTQNLCDVCAVTPDEVTRALLGLTRMPRMISLNATNLQSMFGDIESIGAATGRQDEARRLINTLQGRLDAVRTLVRDEPRRRVACLEWLEPLYSAGHWVPEMVELAGGKDLLATAGEPSMTVSWERMRDARPDVLILMPCGFSIERTLSELDLLTARPGWCDLPAVRSGSVYAVDGPAYFNRPGPRLVNGVELLAALLHPHRFGDTVQAGARKAI